MKHPASSNNKAISLLEVLIAVVIISVALYGLLVSLSAQQISEGQARDTKVLKNLHSQLVREYLKNQHDEDGSNILTSGASYTFVNPALGQDIINFKSSGANNVYNSSLYIIKNGHTEARSAITIYYPYNFAAYTKP